MKKLLFILLLSFSASVFALPEANIRLLERVELDKDTYTLSDIAEVSSHDAKVTAYLEGLSIGSSIRRGYTKLHSVDEIKRVVHEKIKPKKLSLYWHGSNKIRIKSLGQKFIVSELFSKAGDYLNDYLAVHDDGLSKFDIEALLHKEYVFLPYGDVSSSFRVSAKTGVNKRMSVWLDLSVNEEIVSSIPVWFSVKVIRPVYRLKKSLAMRTVLKRSDFDLVYQDVAMLRGKTATAVDIQDGFMFFNNKQEGSVLMKRDIQKIPAVKKHERVEVQVVSQGISIKTFAVAESDADIGEWVKLKNKDGYLYNARVAAIGLAEIN